MTFKISEYKGIVLMNNKKQLTIIAALLGLDQGVKWIIFNQFNQFMGVSTRVNSFLTIHPIFNNEINGANVLWDLGITRRVYILGSIMMLVIYMYIYSHCKALVCAGDMGMKKWVTLISINIAGIIGALIDKLLWGNSLDFMEMGGLIFDFKDVYIAVGSIGLALLAVTYTIVHRSELVEELRVVPWIMSRKKKK